MWKNETYNSNIKYLASEKQEWWEFEIVILFVDLLVNEILKKK